MLCMRKTDGKGRWSQSSLMRSAFSSVCARKRSGIADLSRHILRLVRSVVLAALERQQKESSDSRSGRHLGIDEAHSHGCRRPGLRDRSEEHTSELQSRPHLVCRLLLEKKKK